MWKKVVSEIDNLPDVDGSFSRQSFAILEREVVIALAKAMPDAQSAILLCLAWHACLQERMRNGPLAGEFVARLSGPQLAELTGRPIRTVRYALRKLKKAARIFNEQSAAGKKSIYRLGIMEPGKWTDSGPAQPQAKQT